MSTTLELAPILTVKDREELAFIGDFLGRLGAMRGRDLISAESYATVLAETTARRDEIERTGRYRATIKAARDLSGSRPRDALEWVARARGLEPNEPEAWWLAIELLRRLGRPDEAAQIYRNLRLLVPSIEPTPDWVRVVEARREGTPPEPAAVASIAEAVPAPEPPRPAARPPALAWSSIAGEFLLDQWQRLILCLAVLLIVVSSTVGAHLLLGPRLWSPVGKCALALVYTVTFAGFGGGLARWGAARAGRMMLITTLIVVPVNFMLAGEMRLLIAPTASRLLVLALDAAALWLVIRVVAGVLDLGRGAGTLSAALFALGAFDAGTARGVPFGPGVAAFLLPGWVLLAAVWRLDARIRDESHERRRDFVYLALGLLGFAFLSGTIRSGVVLRLNPALYATPVMLGAMACVRAAHDLSRFEKDRGRVLSMRFGGLVLSGLAFALAFSRPHAPSPLYSGNTLATALLGLALYAALLRAERHPAYLYLAFAALFVGYFGAFYFVVDLVRAVEEAARHALGYSQRLPFPFKALNGLVFNAVLAMLALVFARRWRDERLARHCHALGIPFSIAACVLSGLEPTAAVLCLGGYTVLYAAAVPVFRAPGVIYLACSSLAGALFFGSLLVPGVTLGMRALGAALFGMAAWGCRCALVLAGADRSYRVPLIHAAVVAATAALVAALGAASPPSMVATPALAAFLVAGLLCGLLVVDEPQPMIASLALAGLLGGWLCGFVLAIGGCGSAALLGEATVVLALAMLAAAEGARLRDSVRGRVFAEVLPRFSLVLVLAAEYLAVQDPFARPIPFAATLALGGAALLWATRFHRSVALVDMGLGLVAASVLVLAAWRTGWVDGGAGLGWLALTSAVLSLGFWIVGVVSRRRGDFYAVPCLQAALLLASVGAAASVEARVFSRGAFPTATFALLIDGLVLALLTASWPWSWLTCAAIASVVAATYVTLFSVGTPSPDKLYILGLVAVAEGLLCWRIGLGCRRLGRGDAESLYSRPLFLAAFLLTVLAIPPSHTSAVTMALVAVSFLLTVVSFPATVWIYGAVAATGCAFYRGVIEGLPQDRVMTAGVAGAFALWGLAIAMRRSGRGLCGRLRLPELDLAGPLFQAGLASAVLAAWLRFDLEQYGVAWTAYPALPFALAAFCPLMLAYAPARGWIHAALALVALGVVAVLAPRIDWPSGWLPAGMTLAILWLVADRGLERLAPGLCRRFDWVDRGYVAAVERWSLLAFALAAIPAAAWVVATTGASVFGMPMGEFEPGPRDWSCVLLTLMLAGGFIADAVGRRGDVEDVLMVLYGLLVLVVWWLGAPGSPAPGLLRLAPSLYFPLATVGLALTTVLLGLRFGEDERNLGDGTGSSVLGTFSVQAGLGLALAAAVFTKGWPGATTILTLLAATATLGVLAVARRRVEAGLLAGLTWCSACVAFVFEAARPRWLAPTTAPTLAIAIGATLAAFTLWAAAGWLRRTAIASKGGDSRSRDVATATELAGLLASMLAAAAAGVAFFHPPVAGPLSAALSVGALLAAGVFDILLARRWRSEWLVYAAQAMLVTAYLDASHSFPLPPTADAVVLTLLGYLNLGIAEAMQRLRLDLYARPTLFVSLALPLIPLATALSDARPDDFHLFLFFATATFYGVACYTRQWKPLGYASAVLFNALLWLSWSRNGWQLADHPQFFLVPVGLSAVIFAEVNRRAFDRAAVNAIRGAGLLLIYASLAWPVWQFQTFGSWLALLLGSLAGIFVGIGLRIQSFLWLGLVGFVLDVLYQVGRIGTESALARWGIMLVLGILLILFVALNEKRRVVASMRQFYAQARRWD